MRTFWVGAIAASALSACASTSVQDMSRSMFQVQTSAAPVCGKGGAAKIASKVAAIEVIKRGGDRFVLASSQAGSSLSGFVGYTAISRNNRGIVVKMVEPGDPEYDDALSARAVLGDDWEKDVSRGKPGTC